MTADPLIFNAKTFVGLEDIELTLWTRASIPFNHDDCNANESKSKEDIIKNLRSTAIQMFGQKGRSNIVPNIQDIATILIALGVL